MNWSIFGVLPRARASRSTVRVPRQGAGRAVHRLAPAGVALLAAWMVAFAGGCGAKKREITELQRKEAELLVAEANFAITLRDWARAEGLFVKATNLTPDEGAYWTSLGAMRMRLGHKAAAKTAYERAVKAYQEEIAADKTKSDVEPWLRQVYVLALLGRVSEGRALLDRAARQFPTNREVRAFIDGKQLDAMLAEPLFKQEAL